jgi:beta-phosphoglucomutase-like phosphatase (HAD superfamily)
MDQFPLVKAILFAIVSNNDSQVIRAAHARFDFPSPNVIVGRDLVGHMKPDPEGARLALAELGVQPSDCWLVGNSIYDLALGKALAIRTFIVGSQLTMHPTAIILPSLRELIPWVEDGGR